MTKPRKQQISIETTPYYHVYSRCVRKAFLCGDDPDTGRSYEHRRQQIQDDMLRLSSIFFIKIAAFAILHNHYHLVLYVDKEACMAAPAKDIAKLWHQLFSGKEATQKFIDGAALEPYEVEQVDTYIDLWRSRLYNISWFMKVLNENTARRANKEDDCTGHFWESRYKSQALLDEQALLSCMSYCDLNPIRAGMAKTPEASEHTSIQMRIEYWQRESKAADQPVLNKEDGHEEDNLQPVSLLPFVGNHRQPMPSGIAFNLIDYIELIDWTGRAVLNNKRGSISTDAPAIIHRLKISPEHWLELSTNFESRFKGLVGSAHSIRTLCNKFGLTRQTNRSNSELLFGTST